MNHKIYGLVDDLRSVIPGPGQTCAPTLDRILAAHPYVAHVFVYDPDHGLTFRSQPSRMNEPEFRAEVDDLSGMQQDWMKLEYKELVEKIQAKEARGEPPYYFFTNWAPRGDKRAYQTAAMFLKKSENGTIDIVGMAFDAEYLKYKFLPEAMDGLLA